ncbi:MAG: sucrose-6-phosphate hydrolase, partial [Atopobiaceae bacterium]|nr:sucrose-6-phosphate hydrolase [Atopobiaceae bacterium]
MTHPEWRPLLHVAPERGWVNDPNGLCFFRGRYHAFFQYTLDWRESNLRSWGHAVSDDLLTWEELPVALTPDIPEDRCGVYSGCAFVTEDGERMELYYTGNVVYDGPYDRIHEGREANEILDECADGRHFSEKRVLLRP